MDPAPRLPGGTFLTSELKAEGDLDELDFLGPKIDLGGFNYLLTFNVRF